MYRDPDDGFSHPEFPNATAEIISRMELFGAMPPADEEDPRPLPDDDKTRLALDVMFENLSDLFADSCLESETRDIMWSLVNCFQRKCERLDKGFSQIAYSMRHLIREQDGSEVKSVELEKLQVRAQATEQAREWFEDLRNLAADHYSVRTGNTWSPARGSRTSRNGLTSAMIDSKDFLAARQHVRTMALIPEGPKVIITGGMAYQDHKTIWSALDKTRTRHPDMVLVHGGAPRGTDMIASKWANNRNVPQITFKPDWNRYGKKRAGFVRNDQMLELPPIGVLGFPGTGVTENLVDKARKAGIPTKCFA